MKKIVIIGPESTGKSTLCHQLAELYNTCCCPEFAREYLIENGKDYSYEDLLKIAKGQVHLEEKFFTKAKNGFYFIDTDLYVMKVWCETAFEKCPSWILKQIAIRKYDLYLLCNTDLPWQPDELREYPDLVFRQKLFTTYKDLMINSGAKWMQISGTDTMRLQMAESVINTMFKNEQSIRNEQ